MMRVSLSRLALVVCFAAAAAHTQALTGDQSARDAELFGAIHEGSASRIDAAIEAGANPNARDRAGSTALLEAVVYCDSDVVRRMLSHGADPNAASTAGATPLVLAAGDPQKVQALVNAGADVNAATKPGRTPLLAAAAQRDSFEIVKLLLDKGADISARDGAPEFITGGKGANVLMLAVRSRDNRTVKLLLARGVDVNASNSAGATALTEAISARNAEAVRLLIANGARVNFTFGPVRITPLIWASFQECPEVVETLIAAGADVNAKDALGSTALVWASMSERGDSRTASLLLGAGADVNVKTAMAETPLTWAQRRGQTEIVNLLENAGRNGGKNEDR